VTDASGRTGQFELGGDWVVDEDGQHLRRLA
jgi:hypothetical protein